ncbi:MAG: flippase-like domain-containing protein [Clostridia bacterium]|nr:flippase-like domain-containing protein [Clostridia bacterium]
MKKLSKKAKNQLFSFLFLFLLIGITLTVLLLSYQELNFKNIFDFIKHSKWWLLVIAVVCMIAGVVFEGLSLFVISRKLEKKGKVLPSIAYSSADIYYSAITPSASGGQPAAAYYMVKDGMSAGSASFTLVFNTVAYTASLIILTVFAFCLRPAMFVQFPFWAKFFIILGVVIQVILLLFLFGCMRFDKAVLKCGNGIISFLAKIRIVKNTEKWKNKVASEVGKYAVCFQEIKKHKWLFIEALVFNTLQRVVRIIISCCICLAYDPEISFWSVFALQSFVIVGYTSLPVPGGVGAFEYLYLNIYGIIIPDTHVILSAMMVMRVISYYLSIVVTGAVTLSYHIYIKKRKRAPLADQTDQAEEQPSDEAETPTDEQPADADTEQPEVTEEVTEEINEEIEKEETRE